MTSLLMMVGIFAVFYVLLIMPQQKRQKKWAEMLANLKAGDRVTTTGGVTVIPTLCASAEPTPLVSVASSTAPSTNPTLLVMLVLEKCFLLFMG